MVANHECRSPAAGWGAARVRLHFEANVNDVAVPHHVVLAFQAQLARLFDPGIRLEHGKVFVADYFGADESAGDITVNLARRLQRSLTASQRPSVRFRLARGVEGYQ